MHQITLAVSILGIILVLAFKPARAFAVYFGVILWYPYYLTLPLGTLDFTPARIIIFVMLMRCLLTKSLFRRFKWCRLDTWVTVSMGVYVIVDCLTRPLMEALENQSGQLMNTYLVYLVGRFCIYDRASVAMFAKGVAVIASPLVFFGLMENKLIWRPFYDLRLNCTWAPFVPKMDGRFGMERAMGPHGNPPMFGMMFAMLLPLVLWLRHEKGHWSKWAYVFSGLLVLGTLTSLSSGPLSMLLLIGLLMVLERHRQLIKPLLVFAAFSIIFISIASNRTFYHVICSYVNPFGGSGYHRARIIDLAIRDFGKWFLLGFGGKDPGWGDELGMTWTDVTNEFIGRGVRYGLLGVIVFLGCMVSGLLKLIRLYRQGSDKKGKALIWSLGCFVVAMIITLNSIGLVGVMKDMFYGYMGIVGSAAGFVAVNRQKVNGAPLKTPAIRRKL